MYRRTRCPPFLSSSSFSSSFLHRLFLLLTALLLLLIIPFFSFFSSSNNDTLFSYFSFSSLPSSSPSSTSSYKEKEIVHIHPDHTLPPSFSSSSSLPRRIVVIYATPRFHQEVVSVLACAYHALHYKVIVFINSGIFLFNVMIPFTNAHESNSFDHYGGCVDTFINVNYAPVTLPPSTSVLIFATYPMRVKGGKKDVLAFDLIAQFQAQSGRNNHNESSSSRCKNVVILVTHRTNEAISEQSLELESLFPRSKTYYLFLSNHTAQHAVKTTFEEDSSYRSSYIYPVLPISYISKVSSSSLRSRNNKANSSFPTFSVQGNFGGKHAHRKNTNSVLACIQKLERANPLSTYSIDFIGSGELKLLPLQRGRVRHLQDLSHNEFYKAIAATQFLVPAIGEEEYFYSRATSSIPAALIAEVPVTTSSSFLSLYPCLRDAPMHAFITQSSECETMRVASELTAVQYAKLKAEAVHCAQVYWKDTLATLQKISS